MTGAEKERRLARIIEPIAGKDCFTMRARGIIGAPTTSPGWFLLQSIDTTLELYPWFALFADPILQAVPVRIRH